ncbi:BTAD domain-containing putative transcriptional regulator [Kribbella capetownensis]|uniref:nSTAND1 domain-containing NTPase n=1 Tax=Kribbella capetownensis TaxID=1572659 RepID=UPI0013F46A76|nr:BTAD domain-containing putative transcriptional regulator [Kribbella capetownensis]
MGIAVLGPLTIEGEQGKPRVLARRDRIVLAALTVRPGQVVSAEELADVIWGDRLPPSWQKVIQGCVVRLRKVLGAGAIETVQLGYRLAVSLDEIDAQRFEHAVSRARDLLAVNEAERSALVLADALMLWRGRPHSDLDGWDVARIEVERLSELRQAAEELYVEAALRSGQHDKVLAKAGALVSEAPLRERRWALLATSQYQTGQQGEALRTIRRLREVLDRELGLDPSPEIDVLEQAILRQDPALVAESALPEPDAVCPYRGLESYDVEDADGFFGRGADIAACLHKLADARVLAVVGPSGCGKSSLVRAGVAAAFRADGKRVAIMTPGAHPASALAAAVPGTGPPPVLVVDQCEEVFSLCHDAAERETFLATLSSLESIVIVSLRADRIADISAHPAFARTVEQGLYLLSGMTRDALRSAIEQPARMAALTVEPGLTDLVVNEVADEPGALPLMSHALAETWQRREGRTLTVAGYNASGGIRGAVAQSAEQIYEQTAGEQRPVLRDLLLRLVTPGPDGEPIRSRLPRRLVVTGPADDAMVDRLVASRLVTSDDGVVGLAHESLARAWPRLRQWLDDDLEGQRILHHLAVAADSWDDLGRPDSELYRGSRLARASDWRAHTTSTLTATEQDFLTASTRASQDELRAAEVQARRQLSINRRLRVALVTGAFLLVGALIAGLIAGRQADRADQAATSELARQVGARAQLTDDISLSLLLATHGVRLQDSPETRANLVAAINKHPGLVRSAPAPLGRIENLDVSPDGRRIVSGDSRATVQLYDATSGQALDSYTLGPIGIAPHQVVIDEQVYTTARFSPDGRLIAAYAANGIGQPLDPTRPLRLLSAAALDEVPQQLVLPEPGDLRFHSLAFSADGGYLAAGVQKGLEAAGDVAYGLVWDLRDRQRLPRWVALPRSPQRVALSPDGRTIYSSSPLAAYDVGTGKALWQRQDLVGALSIDVSSTGSLLAVQQLEPAHADSAATALVEAGTGKTVRVLRGQADATRGLAFSADETRIATTDYNREVTVWSAATGDPIQRIQTAEVSWAVAFSPDGRTLYTGGSEGILRAFDLAGQRQYLSHDPSAPARRYLHVLPSGDGRSIAYLWRDANGSWVSFSDAATGRTTSPTSLGLALEGGPRTPAAWHPNGKRLAVHDAHAISVVDAGSGKLLKQAKGLDISSIAYVDNGTTLVTGNAHGYRSFDEGLEHEGVDFARHADCCTAPAPDGRTSVFFDDSPNYANVHWRILRVETGQVLAEGDVDPGLNYASYSPDGSMIALAGASGEVFTIDVATRSLRRAPTQGHSDEAVFVRFSPDGSKLVSGAEDGTVSLWDAHSLELLGRVSVSSGGKPVGAVPSFVDGNDVVRIAAYDGMVYRWDTRIERAIATACAMAGRNLTADEWRQAFGNRPYESTCP